jgi:hypothetical protein
MSGHTPGPWRVINDGVIGVQMGRWGGFALPDSGTHDQDTALANARLIAAAPELLAALKMLAYDYALMCGDGMTDATQPKVLADATAAIAKAEGKS